MKFHHALVILLFLVSCESPLPLTTTSTTTSTTTTSTTTTTLPLGTVTTVTLVFSSFPGSDGTYAVPGIYGTDDWSNQTRTFPLTGHAGTAGPYNLTGTGTESYFFFTVVSSGTWIRPWNQTNPVFGITDESLGGLNNFVVRIPLDKRAHTVAVSYPTGFVLPKITLDGKVPDNITVDGSGRVTAVRSPWSSNVASPQDEFSYTSTGALDRWTRRYANWASPGVTLSVSAYNSSGYLASVTDTAAWGSLVRTFLGTKVDLGTNQITGATETRTDGAASPLVVTSGAAETGETTWTGLAVGGTSVAVPTGTLSLFKGYFEGWYPQLSQWNDGDLSTGVSFVSGGLKASYSAGTGTNVHALFSTILPRLRDWHAYDTVQATIANPGTEDLNVALVVESGSSGLWQETYWSPLPAGLTRTLYFDLTKLRSTETGWTDGAGKALTNNTDVRTVRLKFYSMTQAGSVVVKELKLLSGNPDKAIFDASKIPDVQLRKAIAAATGKTFGVDLTVGDIKTVEWPQWWNFHGVKDLTGLENLASLNVVSLWDDPVPASQYSVITLDHFPLLKSLEFHYLSGTNLTFSSALEVFKRFSRWETVTLASLPNVTQADFTSLYSDILYPNRTTLKSLGFTPDPSSSTVTSVASVANLINLEQLSLSGLTSVTSLNLVSGMTKLNHLSIDDTKVTDLSPLKTLYQAGAFQAANPNKDDWVNRIDLNGLGLDLSTGTPNRTVIDYLVGKGVRVDYGQGNITAKVAVSTKAITIDGSFADWASVTPALVDPSGDVTNGALTGLDVTGVSVAVSGTKVVVRVKSAGSAIPSVQDTQFGLAFVPYGGGKGVRVDLYHQPDGTNQINIYYHQYSASGAELTSVHSTTDGAVAGSPGDIELSFPLAGLTTGATFSVGFDTQAKIADTWSSNGDHQAYDSPVYVIFP